MGGTGRVNVSTVMLVLIALLGIAAVTAAVIGPKVPPMPSTAGFEVIGQRLSFCPRQDRAILVVFYNRSGTDDGLAELVAVYAAPDDFDAGRPFVAVTFKTDEQGALLLIYVDRNLDGRAEVVTSDVDDERLGASPCDVLPETK